MQQPKINELFSGKFRLMIVAQSEAGKTQMLYQILTNPKFGLDKRFKADQFFIISPNQEIDDCQIKLIEWLREHECNEDQKFNEDEQLLNDISIANNYIKNLYDNQYEAKKVFKKQEKEGKENPYPYYEKILILDDILGNPKFKTGKGSILDELITQCRHVDINVIILTQYYKSISAVVRGNCSHFLIFNQPKSDEIMKIRDEVSGSEKNRFMELFQDATSQKYSALLILNKLIPKCKFFRFYNNDQVYQYNL